MKRAALACLVAATGMAHTVTGQVTWSTSLGFSREIGGLLPGNFMVITATGTYTFIVRAGVFGLSGQSPGQHNYGLANWTGTVTASGLNPGETLGVSPSTARIAPFDFGPAAGHAGTLDCNAIIQNIDLQRDVTGGASAPWPFGSPVPTAPIPGAAGAESLAPVWRFTVTVTSRAGPDIIVNVSGQAAPVLQWVLADSSEPDDEFSPGSATFTGVQPALQPHPVTSLVISRGVCNTFFTQHPVAQSVTTNAPVFFSVKATNPGTYQWRRNGVDLADTSRVGGTTTPTLTIFPTLADDAGLYDCVITSVCDSSTTTALPASLSVYCPADADRNGSIEPADIARAVSDWFAALNGGC